MSHKISMEQDYAVCDSWSAPNPGWCFADKAGHEHRWAGNDEIGWELPTLRLVVESEATDDYPAVAHYECKQCGQRVEPGTGERRYYIPTTKRYYINGEPATEEEARAIMRKGGKE